MALSKLDKTQIKSIMEDERWTAVETFLALKLTQWRAEPVVGQNAFEELRSLHKRDGRVEGLLEFFNQMDTAAFDV